ncbi:MAG: flagellar hook protein FlgK [Pseudomonadota bacterium]|jgi:flagellar hook-associated protein 1 FlgK
MIDLLGIGASGVRAYQAALAQTGDNVANADTEGYARRSLKLAAGPGAAGTPFSRASPGGAGVIAGAITRAGDPLKINAARVASGDHARFAARGDWLDRLQTVMTGSDVNARLGGFFDAASDLANAPTATAARTIFLDRADQVAAAFRSNAEKLDSLAADLNSATATAATEINAITATLAKVNGELRRTQAGGTAANSLLDTRDSLLADLADRIRISVTEGERGTVTVKLGSGGAAAVLVPDSGSAVRIGVRDDALGAQIVLDPTHSATPVRLPASGSLAGLVEAARQVGAARGDLDALADRFAAGVNLWHQNGSDARGDPGQPLFATTALTVVPGKANAGSAAVDVTQSDSATPFADGYTMVKDATGFTLARRDSSASITGPSALTLDGITVTPGVGARDGDGWALAVGAGAAGLALRPLGPERLAVAARFIADGDAGNRGDGRITLTSDAGAAAFPDPPPYRLLVTAPGTAVLSAGGVDLATLTLDGSAMVGNGFRFTVTGTPATGDSFRILASAAGSSDNGNILALADLRADTGPGGTLEASLDASIAGLASRLAESDRLRDATLAVKDDAARAADAVSGIDLSREAAELTRLQMAFRANSQVIAAARDLFDAILGASR